MRASSHGSDRAYMPFTEFLGNPRIVAALHGMLASGRVPHAMLFAGPRGVGKFTLARMFAQAANCERLTDDFCGECDRCQAIARLQDTQTLIRAGACRARRKRGLRDGRARSTDPGNAPGCVGNSPRSGAAEKPCGAARPARRPIARGAACCIFQAAREAPRFYYRRRGHDALGPCQHLPQDPGGAARNRHVDPAGSQSVFCCCRRFDRAACSSSSARSRWSKSSKCCASETTSLPRNAKRPPN